MRLRPGSKRSGRTDRSLSRQKSLGALETGPLGFYILEVSMKRKWFVRIAVGLFIIAKTVEDIVVYYRRDK